MTAISTPRPPSIRSHSTPAKIYPPTRPAPPRPDGTILPPPSKRPKSLLARFRRVSQYDQPSSSTDTLDLLSIPTLERLSRRQSEIEVDVDWEKVKTLPRVCLVPPEEDNGQTVTLYPLLPPPRPIDIRSRDRDDTSSLRTTGTGDTSIWGGMAPGFILPPPVFSRRGQPVRGVKGRTMNVVMPKKKSEVVADRTRRLAREMIDGPEERAIETESEVSADAEADHVLEAEREVEANEEIEGQLVEEEAEMNVDVDVTRLSTIRLVTQEGEVALPPSPDLPGAFALPIAHSESLSSSSRSRTIVGLEPALDIKPPTPPIPDDEDNDQSNFIGSRLEESRDAEQVDSDNVVAGLLDEDMVQFEHTIHSPSVGLVNTELPFDVDSPPSSLTKQDEVSSPLPPPQSIEMNDTPQSPPLLSCDYTIDPLDHTAPPLNRPRPFTSRDLNLDKSHHEAPRAPSTPGTGGGLRKQKSLKQLLSFGFPSPPPPVPPLPSIHQPVPPSHSQGQGTEPSRKRTTILSRSSKPSLRVEVKSPKIIDNGPVSAPTLMTSTPGPSQVERPKMVKRFSLSNMSSAFKKMAHGHGHGSGQVPKVPDLPQMYRRKSDQDVAEDAPRRRSEEALPTPQRDMNDINPTPMPIFDKSASAARPILEPAVTITQTRLNRSMSFSSVSSSGTTPSRQHETLLHISPRTQRDPSASLQDYLTRVHSTEVTITERPTHTRQKSQEAMIVLSNTPPAPLPRSSLMKRDDSLGNLSQSSQSSSHRSSQESQTLKTPVIVPVASMSLDEIRRHIPIAPPRTITIEAEAEVGPNSAVEAEAEAAVEAIESADSFQSLPSLGSEMIVVNSPTSTVASVSTGTSSGASAGSRSGPSSRSGSRGSTPKARSLVRMITSPRRHLRNASKPQSRPLTQPLSQTQTQDKETSPRSILPPRIPSSSTIGSGSGSGKRHDSLTQSVQLESLHFESLDLDFSTLNLNWEVSGPHI